MARPLSEEKREAILASAARLVATLGTGAPTAKIARDAGVAEGTLFTYFATKDELINQLFLAIEADLASTLLESHPTDVGPREQARHLWDRFIDWGAAHPMERKALRQLKVSDRISDESRRRGEALFREIRTIFDRNLAGHVGEDRTSAYIGAVLDALVETTLEFIARDPGQHDHYRQAGFDVFWKGIGR